MEAAADAAECVVAAEAQAVLARKCPVQRGSTVKRQFRMSIFELCAGQLQRFVQLVQPFQIVVQPQQAAVAQAVVAFFLVQGAQQVFQPSSSRRYSGSSSVTMYCPGSVGSGSSQVASSRSARRSARVSRSRPAGAGPEGVIRSSPYRNSA